jgi:hypothetical protein
VFREGLDEVFLGLFEVDKGAIFLKPLFSSLARVPDSDRLSAVEDNGHVFIEIRSFIDRFSVEFFF